MKNSKINTDKKECSISHTKMYTGDNNELICIKVYQGDWGHWDEKPESCEPVSPTESDENSDEQF